jgi:hypothetical protein
MPIGAIVKLWKGDHGQLLINADGNIISCDSCPFGNALTEILDVTVSGFEDWDAGREGGAEFAHLNGTWRVGVSHQAGAGPNTWVHKADTADLCDWDPEDYHFDITWTYDGKDYRAFFAFYIIQGSLRISVLVERWHVPQWGNPYWSEYASDIWYSSMKCDLRTEVGVSGDYVSEYDNVTPISVSVEVVGDCP